MKEVMLNLEPKVEDVESSVGSEKFKDCGENLPDFEAYDPKADDSSRRELPDGMDDCAESLPYFGAEKRDPSETLSEELKDCSDHLPVFPEESMQRDGKNYRAEDDAEGEVLLETDESSEPNESDSDSKGDDVLMDGDQFDEDGGLKPNITYEINGIKYTTDEQGRIIKAEGSLEIGDGKRNPDAQLKAGGEDRESNDDGGHLIGNRFNGSGELDNIVAMDGKVNRGDFKKLENSWAKALDEGKEVLVKIEPIYEGDSKRPVAFRVTYSIDGDKFSTTLKNTNMKEG